MSRLSTAILQEMWEKWVFIATIAGITCLMRATVGDIVAAGGAALTTSPAGRMHGHCGGARLRAEPSDPVQRSANHVDHAGLHVCRLDAARHRARRADRGRPHGRRSAATRPSLEARLSAAADRLYASEGLRGAAQRAKTAAAPALTGTFVPISYYSAKRGCEMAKVTYHIVAARRRLGLSGRRRVLRAFPVPRCRPPSGAARRPGATRAGGNQGDFLGRPGRKMARRIGARRRSARHRRRGLARAQGGRHAHRSAFGMDQRTEARRRGELSWAGRSTPSIFSSWSSCSRTSRTEFGTESPTSPSPSC